MVLFCTSPTSEVAAIGETVTLCIGIGVGHIRTVGVGGGGCQVGRGGMVGRSLVLSGGGACARSWSRAGTSVMLCAGTSATLFGCWLCERPALSTQVIGTAAEATLAIQPAIDNLKYFIRLSTNDH